MPHQHFCALVDEMTDNVDRQSTAPKGRRILNLLRDRIHGLLAPPLTAEEQRVTNDAQRVIADHLQAEEQRVIDDSPNMTVPRITDAPTIMNSRNPTAKRMLKITPRVHGRVTRNNTRGIVATPVAPAPYVPSPSVTRQRRITRHTVNLLTKVAKTVRFTTISVQRGLPQAGILANKRLRRKLDPFGYFEHANTPGLWSHRSCPISITLVVDDIGVKYVSKTDVDHLVASIKSTYTLTVDWSGNLYCGIKLDWDYVGRTIDISMPGYIAKKLQEYKHIKSKTMQSCPYTTAPKQFGSKAQRLLPPDVSPLLDKKGIKRV